MFQQHCISIHSMSPDCLTLVGELREGTAPVTPVIVALDAGTSSAKALVCEASTGSVLARASVPVALDVRGPGEVEQDAEEILQALLSAAHHALSGLRDCVVQAVALTNQRESVVAWQRSTGEPIGPMLSWQDSRTSEAVASWDGSSRAQVKALTGLTLDAMYSAPKMRWLLDHAGRDDVMVGTLESWIIARLTGEAVAEAGNASRTMLLSLQTGDWDDGLLDAFGVSRDVLPQVRHSNADFGRIRAEGQSLAGVPIVAVLADSHASLFAHHAGAVGVAKATLGTGTSVMAALAELGTPCEGVDTTLAWWLDQPTYALEGNILATGQAIDWVAGLLEPASTRPGGVVVAEAAASVDGSHGVTLVPAFTGLGAPHWDRGAVALLSGMTAATSTGHVARAALESVAHQVADVVESMVAVGAIDLHELRVDGGGSSSDLLLQSQSDLLGVPVVRVREPELSAMGVARLASIRLGHDPGPVAGDTAAHPEWSADRRERERHAWKREVDRARMRIEER